MKSILLSCLIFFQLHLFSQGYSSIHANEIKTGMHSNGSLFFDEDLLEAGFWIPYEGLNSPAALFAGGIWMGGLDPSSNLKLGAIEYGGFNRGTYIAGPNNAASINFDFEKVWKISLSDVKELLSDIADGQVDDTPAKALLEWPGSGNPYYNGNLPIQQLAPFTDTNQDGIYNPFDGDYPTIDLPSGTITPDEMLYTVYFDGDNFDLPTEIEVHSIMYAFNTENEIINNSVFNRFVLINQGNSDISDFRFSYWIDPDLGCFADDYIGCDSSRNTMFVYNSDPIDGDVGSSCNGGVITYAENPPVITVSFLNHDLSSFLAYYNSATSVLPAGMTDPNLAEEYYHFMNGVWRDGTPMTIGRLGFDPDGTDEISFAFPDLPTDPNAWSMVTVDPPFLDARTLSSISKDIFSVGETMTIDVAISSTFQETNNHLDLVEIALNNTDYIKEAYHQNGLSNVKQTDYGSSIYISPNPNDGSFIVEGAQAFESYLLTDILGKQIRSAKITGNNFDLGLTPNIYFLHLSANDEKRTKMLRLVVVQ